MLAEAERERRLERAGAGATADRNDQGWLARGKARTMRWVAESIAEQRLLWHLRRQTDACLFYPDDIDEARATGVLRSQLKTDFEKHRFWLTIDSIGFIISGRCSSSYPGPTSSPTTLPSGSSATISRCAARDRDCPE